MYMSVIEIPTINKLSKDGANMYLKSSKAPNPIGPDMNRICMVPRRLFHGFMPEYFLKT